MTDARIGIRDGSGTVTTKPTQYSDGSSLNYDQVKSSGATELKLSSTAFTVLPPSTNTISSSLLSTLQGLAGASAALETIADARSLLGITAVANYYIFDQFEGATLDTDKWTADTNGTAAAASQLNAGVSSVSIVSGTDDDGWATLAGDQTWLSSNTLTLIEARLKISAITEVVVEFGLSDAQSEAAGIAFTSHDATPVAVADNAVVFGFQHDTSGGETSNANWSALNVNATTAARADTSTAIAADTWVELAIQLAKDGAAVDAGFYIDGVQVASVDSAIAASIALYPWLAVKARSTSASRTLEVDYVRVSHKVT